MGDLIEFPGKRKTQKKFKIKYNIEVLNFLVTSDSEIREAVFALIEKMVELRGPAFLESIKDNETIELSKIIDADSTIGVNSSLLDNISDIKERMLLIEMIRNIIEIPIVRSSQIQTYLSFSKPYLLGEVSNN